MLDRREKIRKIVRSLLKLIILLGVLWLIKTILLVLPGINSQILNSPITFSITTNVVFGVLMILAVLKFGREINQPVKIFQEPSLKIRTIAKYLIYLVVIGMAYSSFYPLVQAILPDYAWVYALALLIIAILPIARVSIDFYYSIDKWVDVLSKRLVKTKLKPTPRTNKCLSCGSSLTYDAIYCANCGAKIK